MLKLIQKHQFYIEKGVSEAESLFLMEDKKLADYFDKVVEVCEDYKKTSSFVLSIMVGVLKKEGKSISDVKITSEQMAKLIRIINKGEISMNLAKSEIFEEMYKTGQDPEKIILTKDLKIINNTDDITIVCEKILKENKKILNDYLGGKNNAFKALMGLVMKETKGQANPVIVNQLLTELINKNK